MRKKTLIQIAVFAFCFVSMNDCGLFTPKEFFPERSLWYEEPADFFEDMDHGLEVEGYSRNLDLRRALATTEYRIGSTMFRREVFVSFPDQMLFIRLFSSEPKALDFSVRCSSQLRNDIKTNENHQLILDGRGPIHAEPNYRGDIPNALIYDENPNGKGMRFRALVTVLETDGSVEHSDTEISVHDAKEALIAVAIATSFNGFDKEPGTEGKDPKMLTDSLTLIWKVFISSSADTC